MDERASAAVVVAGATPGGVAAAARAAREGEDACLVAAGDHVGGMMAGGLSYTDTLTKKPRAPLLEAFVGAVAGHYRSTYGPDSTQFERCEDGYVFEPHVARETFEDLLEEARLDVRRGYRPVAVERAGRNVRRVTFESTDGDGTLDVAGEVFVDATYEGDLAAAAGVPCRVGRESRAEHGEQFAGRIFTDVRGDRYYPREAVGPGDASAPADRAGPLDVPADRRRGDLDLIPHPAGLTEIFPGSTGEGDDAVQAYNYRLCLSRDPDNRRLPEKPDGYDRTDHLEALQAVEERGLRSHLLLRYLPNRKADMNAADLPGENHDYPTAGPRRRAEIADRHRRHALGLLYFLQNDDAVPGDVRAEAREWGLAGDEFVDTDNFPPQLYVREARRIEGRYTFTENDARHAPGLERTPVHADAVAIAEYPLDSHACWPDRRLGSQPEGFFYASQVTRPSQVPYRALLPAAVENLLVPVALSASHVGFGTVRLEPTWMHLGEAAGFAAALARERGTDPGELDVDRLQRRLAEAGVMLSFFNDAGVDDAYGPAVTYLGTKGLFDGYDARPDATLTAPVADAWVEAAAGIRDGVAASGRRSATGRARALPAPGGDGADAGAFAERLAAACEADAGALLAAVDLDGGVTVTRGDACRMLYRATAPGES